MSNVRLEQTHFHAISGAEPLAHESGAHEDGAAQLLPAPSPALISDDAITQLAVLLSQMDRDERKSSRASRAAEESAQAREDAAQVASMRAKADDLRSEGLATGILEAGAAAAEFAGAVYAIKASDLEQSASTMADAATGAEKAGNELAKAGFEASKQLDLAKAGSDKLLSAILSGSAKGMSASGKTVSGQFRGAEAEHDADAKMHADAAGVHERAAKSAHEDAIDAKEAEKKVLEWVKEMQASQHGAELTAASLLKG